MTPGGRSRNCSQRRICPLPGQGTLNDTPECVQQSVGYMTIAHRTFSATDCTDSSEADHATARIEEAAFFKEDEPWTTALNMYSSRLGILQLRAQLAIPNPGSSHERYKPGIPLQQREHRVKFSPNVIRRDISGPGLSNPLFDALPGVINVTDNTEEAYLMPLIRNVVKEYIKAENCINLLAPTMTHDAVNSSAFGLIKEMKAEARTVGCLTKPDRMDPGEALDQWIRILHGEEYQLGFGYHVIKNNPNPEVDHATARIEETAFFRENEPWTIALSMYSGRLDTLPLHIALSQQLLASIRPFSGT